MTYWKCLHIADRALNLYNTLENNLVLSIKFKDANILWPRNLSKAFPAKVNQNLEKNKFPTDKWFST